MKKTLEEKQLFWKQHFEDCKTSGLSQSEYCKRHNVVESQFYYWKKQLGFTRPQSKVMKIKKPSQFIPVQVSSRYQSGIIIRLQNGVSIEGISAQDESLSIMLTLLNRL